MTHRTESVVCTAAKKWEEQVTCCHGSTGCLSGYLVLVVHPVVKPEWEGTVDRVHVSHESLDTGVSEGPSVCMFDSRGPNAMTFHKCEATLSSDVSLYDVWTTGVANRACCVVDGLSMGYNMDAAGSCVLSDESSGGE